MLITENKTATVCLLGESIHHRVITVIGISSYIRRTIIWAISPYTSLGEPS